MAQRKTARQTQWDMPGRGRLFNFQAGRFRYLNEYATGVEAYFVREHLKGNRLLDIGAGTGRVALKVAGTGEMNLLCLDPSPAMLRRIVLDQQAGLVQGRLFPIVGVSLGSLPLRDGSCNHAYSFGVLSHFENWLEVIKPVANVLRPGGNFLFNLKSEDSLSRWFDQGAMKKGFFHSQSLVQELTSVGLYPERLFSTPLLTGSILLRAWGAPGEEIDSLNVFSMNWWVNSLLGEVSHMDSWLMVEIALSRIMPCEAALSSIVLTSRLEDKRMRFRDEQVHLRGLDQASFYRSAVKILLGPPVLKSLEDPSVFRLLCVLGPLLDLYSGSDHLLTDLFPDRREIVTAVGEEMAYATSPRFMVQVRKACAEWPVWMMTLYYGLRQKLRRTAS